MCVFVRAFHARPSLSCRFAADGRTTMTRDKNRIYVVGPDFVGLSLATVNAKIGFDIIDINIDSNKIDSLKMCRPDFFEPDINTMLMDSIKRKKIHFTTDLDYALQILRLHFLPPERL